MNYLFLALTLTITIGCGGITAETGTTALGGAGGAGGEATAVSCDETLLSAERVGLVAYEIGGNLVVRLDVGESICITTVEDDLCVYHGGEVTPDNFVPRGAIADPSNSTRCAPNW